MVCEPWDVEGAGWVRGYGGCWKMREGVSGYLACLLWLKSNSTVWGVCVVFHFPIFGYIYMKGRGGPCIYGQSSTGGGGVRHPFYVGLPSFSLALFLRLYVLVLLSYGVEF